MVMKFFSIRWDFRNFMVCKEFSGIHLHSMESPKNGHDSSNLAPRNHENPVKTHLKILYFWICLAEACLYNHLTTIQTYIEHVPKKLQNPYSEAPKSMPKRFWDGFWMSFSPKRVPDASKKPLGTALRPSWKRLGLFRKLFGASGGRRGIVLEPLEDGSGASWGRLGAI